ncbi:MAG: homoserine kinase [Bacillota bacterium]
MSSSEMWITSRAPASTANLGPGFDSLGMALPLFTTIHMRRSPQTSVSLKGPELSGLPANADNLVIKILQELFSLRQLPAPSVEVVVESDIPLTRGLGSSAAAIVAALLAGNELLRESGAAFSRDELFQIATRIEGHPDNVAASLYGGFVVTVLDGQQAYCQKLLPPPSLYVTVAVPVFPLPTEKARHVLPNTYSRQDAVFNLSRAALLVAALATGSLEMIRHAMQDRLHQPYRIPLIPGMEAILAHGHEYGALGCALSGAGPSVLALSDGEKPELGEFMRQAFLQRGIEAHIYTFRPWPDGAEVKRVEMMEGSIR